MKINKRLVELAVISPILVIFTLNHDKFLPRVKRQVGWLIDWLTPTKPEIDCWFHWIEVSHVVAGQQRKFDIGCETDKQVQPTAKQAESTQRIVTPC